MNALETIRKSYEDFLNINTGERMCVLMNYADIRHQDMKAFHTITITFCVIKYDEDKKKNEIVDTIEYKENYNHGNIYEQDAKEAAVSNFLTKVMLEKIAC